jgi:hypothetical protein
MKYRANLEGDCKSNDWAEGIKGSVFDFGREWPEMDGIRGGAVARSRVFAAIEYNVSLIVTNPAPAPVFAPARSAPPSRCGLCRSFRV